MSRGCATIESVPPGWRIWRSAVPATLGQFAVQALRNATRRHPYPYGEVTETIDYNGQTVGAWASSHPWSTKGGKIVYGCYDGIALVTPDPTVGSGNTPRDSIQTPDPNAAVFSEPTGIDWAAVGLSALAGAGIVGAFWLFMKHQPLKHSLRRLP